MNAAEVLDLACKAVCAMCCDGVGFEDAPLGPNAPRHYDGEAYYRCDANGLRRVVKGFILPEELHR